MQTAAVADSRHNADRCGAALRIDRHFRDRQIGRSHCFTTFGVDLRAAVVERPPVVGGNTWNARVLFDVSDVVEPLVPDGTGVTPGAFRVAQHDDTAARWRAVHGCGVRYDR